VADGLQRVRRPQAGAAVEALVGPEAVSDGHALGADEDEAERTTERKTEASAENRSKARTERKSTETQTKIKVSQRQNKIEKGK
jgi:hypothetical protein